MFLLLLAIARLKIGALMEIVFDPSTSLHNLKRSQFTISPLQGIDNQPSTTNIPIDAKSGKID